MALLNNFFPARDRGPLFVTTAEIVACLEKMLNDAEKSIIIISPYIKISQRIRSILLEKISHNVDVTIVHREDFDLCGLKANVFKRNNLHAKCFFTEKSALIGSMNLHDYSQTNNDEMGFFLSKKDNNDIYENIKKEVFRLCNTFSLEEKKPAGHRHNDMPGLQIGKQYSREEIARHFPFVDDYVAGIKQTTRGDIVLFYFSKSNKYINEEKNGILYFMGQNTGTETQALIYGNKALYESFATGKGRIFLFKDNIFQGECRVCNPPFQKNGKWIFPLQRLQAV